MGINNFPKYLSIQTTSLCNASCIFCPYEDVKTLFPRKIMDPALYKKIIDECNQYQNIEKIILYLNNEPLTDPYLIERINYAKERVPWASVHILTNGSLLSDKLADKLINSKLDWIGFSLHGVRKETIEKTMGLNYDLTFNRVLKFIEKAREKRNIKDFIMVTFLRHKFLSLEEKEETFKFWYDKGIERISYFDGPVSRAGNARDLPKVKHKELKGCTSIWANEMIHIVENGDVILCCMDWNKEVKLGNVDKQSIYDIWNSKLYEDVRDKRDGRKDAEDSFLCKRCEAAIPEEESKPSQIILNRGRAIDILLIICPMWAIDMPSLGPSYLASYLENEGFSVEILDINIELYNKSLEEIKKLWDMQKLSSWNNEDLFYTNIKEKFQEEIDAYVNYILSLRVKVIGFSLYGANTLFSIEIVKELKRNNPDLTIIFGGPTCFWLNENCAMPASMYSSKTGKPFIPIGLVDVFVKGEGENTLHEIMKGTQAKKGYSDIPGTIIYHDGAYSSFVPRDSINNLDTIPFPAFHKLPLSLYREKNRLPLLMNRGCIRHCNFCCDWKLSGLSFRMRSSYNVFEEIKYDIQKYHTKDFIFCDLIINGNLKELEKLCNLLIDANLGIKWTGQGVIRKDMDYALLRKMNISGCQGLTYGIESFSDSVLSKMNKPYTAEDAKTILKDTKKAGIKTDINLIVGFPGEGESEFKETLEFFKNNYEFIDEISSLNPCYVAGNSELEIHPERFLIKLPKINWWRGWESVDGKNTYLLRKERVKQALDLLKNLKTPVRFIGIYDEDIKENEQIEILQTISKKIEFPDVLLVICPMWGTDAPPLGVSYLHSYLKKLGYVSSVLDINIDMFREVSEDDRNLWRMQSFRLWNDKDLFETKILALFDNKIDFYTKKILALNTKIIGFSVNAGNLLFSIELARRIKDREKNKTIIFGGPHSKWFQTDIYYLEKYKDVYRGFYPGLVDIFVIGEGEVSLGEILYRLKNNKEMDNIPGVILYRNDRYLCLGEESFIDNLDNLPFPDFSWADLDRYTEKKLPIIMSKGCIRKCSFCNDTFVSAKYRCRNAESIFEEIKLRLKENKINNFEFFDLILNGNLQELERLCDFILRDKIGIAWTGQAGIRKDMSRNLLFKMKKAGCSTITYGIESFSNKVLKLMNKPYTFDDIHRVLRNTAKSRISIYINIITGFPGEGEEEFNETLERIKLCRRYINGVASLAPCLITLHSNLQLNLEKYGIICSDKNGYFTWYNKEGNNYELRKKRAKKILLIAEELNLPVGIVNLYDEQNQEQTETLQFTSRKKNDILLVTLPPWGIENPPIGLGYLDSYIRTKGLSLKVFDFNIYFYNTVDSAYKMLWHVENKNYWSNEKTFPLIRELFKTEIDYAINKILSTDTDLIGFSVVDPKERLTMEVIKRIKDKAPDKKIILGGPACSTEEQRDFFTDNLPGYIDYFVVGEGEETLYEIIQRERSALNRDNLAGVAMKVDGKWQYTPRQPINPIDTIPFPNYEGFDLSQYNGGRSLLVEWSRGCIGRCSFCKNYLLVPGYRARNPESIIGELDFIFNHDIKEVTVCDSLMNGDIKQLSTLCDKVIKNSLKIKWSGQIAPRKEMNYVLFAKMRKAGCFKIQIGVESGSDQVLRNMRKIYTARTAQENIRVAKRAGMEVEVFIMIGFPGEGEKEFKQTYKFIKDNASYIDTIKSINTLHLIAGTDVYENYQKYNLKPLSERNWHYLWETYDGNIYEVRKERAERLLDLVYNLGLRVMETNIKEGKEELFSDISATSLPEQLQRLKTEINHLQRLPQGETKIRILKRHHPLKFLLLGFIFIYTLFYITYFWIFKKLRGKSLLGGS